MRHPLLGTLLLTALIAIPGCGGSGDGTTTVTGDGASGVPSAPAPAVDDAVRARRDNFKADEGKIRPEWLPQGFTLRVVDETGADGPLYLMCNYNGMAPADPEWQLAQQGDGSWQLFIPEQNSAEPMSLHITRGSIASAHRTRSSDASAPATLGFIGYEPFRSGAPYTRTIIVTAWQDG